MRAVVLADEIIMTRLCHTNYLLWALFGLTTMFLLGLYHPDGEPSEGLWGRLRTLVTGEPAFTSEAAIGVVIWMIVLTPPSLLAGWLGQAVVTKCGIRLTGRPSAEQAPDYDDV